MKEIEIKNIDGYIHADVPLTKEDWLDVLNDANTPQSYIGNLLKFYYAPGHETSCKQVGDDYGTSSQAPNNYVIALGRYVQQRYGFTIHEQDGKRRFWITVMDGKQDGMLFIYKVRDELCQAIKEWLYQILVGKYISFRRERMAKGAYDELYKWQLITACQGKSLLEQASLWKDTNLYDTIRDRVVVNDMLANHANDYSRVLSDLCDEDEKLNVRLDTFRSDMEHLANANLSSKARDERTASLILTCHDPQHYTFYKYDLYKGLCAFLGEQEEKQVSRKYPHYLRLLAPLTDKVAQDKDLQGELAPYLNGQLHSDLLTAQDICWCFFHMDTNYLPYPPKKKTKGNNDNNDTEMKYQTYISLLLANHNLIFTGAPGTGKTYMARQMAAEMIGCKPEDLDKSGHFGFVQFHPSYDYTDFVEGLRPRSDDGNGQIGFELKDGVFKKFCAKALPKQVNSNFDEVYDTFIETIGSDEDPYKLKTPTGATFAVSVNSKDNLNLHTGKGLQKQGVLTKEGLKSWAEYGRAPVMAWKGYYDGVVKAFKAHFGLILQKQEAQPTDDKPYIFVIDEINRGEMSKIFGELFFSVDPGYRGLKGAVKTQYANMQDTPNDFDHALGIDTEGNYGHFFVPENVYIIGTMNDIDRSVESMDFAMRRRFVWQEVKVEDTIDMLNTLSTEAPFLDKDLVDRLKQRMRNLNAAIMGQYKSAKYTIAKSLHLGEAYQIGGAYFLKFKEYYEDGEDEAFRKLWDNHLKNVLSEYLRGNTNAEEQLEYLHTAFKDETAPTAEPKAQEPEKDE